MSDEKKGLKFFDKLKKVKHIEIYIAVIFIVILLLIYMSNFSNKGSGGSQSQSNTISDSSITSYINDLETNLEGILSNIGGVSNVKVMITLDMNKAEVSDNKITHNSFPPIKGVIVTAKGVGNTATKLKVLQAIEAVLDITNGNIEILSSD